MATAPPSQDLRTAEEKLRESEERLSLALAAGETGAWDWDLERGLANISDSYRELFGITPEAPFGYEQWLAAIHPDDRERCRAYGEAFFSSRAATEWSVEFRVVTPHRGVRWHRAVGRLRRAADGTPLRFVGVSSDITARREAEEALRKSEAALREAHRRKDQFMATLAHELRNPVSALGLNAALLARAKVDDPLARKALPAIVRQAKHLQRLTDDLLDIARATHGKLRLKKERVGLLATARAITEDYARVNPHASLSASGEEVCVDADPARVRQMIENLLDNALKYGGTHIALRTEGARMRPRLSVTDDGRGIEPELLANLFEPFVQGRQTLERSQGGLGLGLALVERLAALQGGGLEAHSDGPGKGSTFTFWLPAAAPAQPAKEAAAPTAAAKKRRVLIVEDEPDAREALRLLLEADGHDVSYASNGDEGLEKLRASPPEVALVDVGLPGLDGYELARRTRALPGGVHVRLIAITGYGTEQDRARAREAGFDEHITKPIAYDDLVRAI